MTTPSKPAPKRPHWLFYLVLALALVAAALSAINPAAGDLPDVALGSRALLYVLRGVAFFAATLLLVIVLYYAFKGELPTEISGQGFGYAGRQLQEEAETSLTALTEAVASERAKRNELKGATEASLKALSEAIADVRQELRRGGSEPPN